MLSATSGDLVAVFEQPTRIPTASSVNMTTDNLSLFIVLLLLSPTSNIDEQRRNRIISSPNWLLSSSSHCPFGPELRFNSDSSRPRILFLCRNDHSA